MNLVPQTQNHAPVTVAVFASALAGIIMAFAKAKYGVNFEGQEQNIQMVATAIGYFVTNRGATAP